MGDDNAAEPRWHDEPLRFSDRNPAMCMTCANAHGEPPWEDDPNKVHCMAYPRETNSRKPPSVYYDGGPCQFYRGI